MAAKICFILGTRPEAIKLYPVIKVAQQKKIAFFIIHSNQHYDYEMDAIFFKELGLPEAKYNLGIGSGLHGVTTGAMVAGIEPILLKEKPSHVLVQGDTNTVLAGAIAASKLSFIKVCHVEAGLRSYDREMPEEINRVIADHVSDFLFCPTMKAQRIAIGEKIPKRKIFMVGNTIVDAVLGISGRKTGILKNIGEKYGSYVLLTAHRPSNVDNPLNLKAILTGVAEASLGAQKGVVFPAHPRTSVAIKKYKIKIPEGIKMISPVGYADMLTLQKNAYMVLTDSGGIQEEACILKKKCLILRKNTERPETLEVGGSMLLKEITAREITKKFKKLDSKKVGWKNPFGDGKAGIRIISALV